MLETITQTRNYLTDVEEHYTNVQKAWQIIQEKCSDLYFIEDEYNRSSITSMVEIHDKSKLTIMELVPYRMNFNPTEDETKETYQKVIDDMFSEAWNHHKQQNGHHWQHWTTLSEEYSVIAHWYAVEMICDWMAMSMVLGDTAQEYYEKNKEWILLPEWGIKLIYSIFDRIYKDTVHNKEEN